jgi:pyruvate,water dikinase
MSRSWREDPTSVLHAAQRGLPDTSPELAAADRAADREAAEAELLAGLRTADRATARLILALVRRYVPLREVGKAMYIQAVDVARAVARGLGRDWHARGELAEPDDIFFLTIPEIGRGPGPEVGEIVAVRRRRHAEYQRLALPRTWTGMPTPIPIDQPAGAETEFRGVAVSTAATVRGTARVVLDPAETEGLDPGEILVCETTDPSWVTLFDGAAAVVIDVGGPLSHGAIVARELGIPAVINTGGAAHAIRTGDLLEVDGRTGTVSVLKSATADTPAIEGER